MRSLTSLQYILKQSSVRSFRIEHPKLIFESKESPKVEYQRNVTKTIISIGNETTLVYKPNRIVLPTKYLVFINEINSFYHEADPIIGFMPTELTNGTDTYRLTQNTSTNHSIIFNKTVCADLNVSKHIFSSPKINLEIKNAMFAPICILLASLFWEKLDAEHSS